jgi:hypothetical protein
VHYSAGLGSLASLGGAGLAAEQVGAAPLARILLEASGALFALYLIIMIVISIAGRAVRRRSAAAPAHAIVRERRPSRGQATRQGP